MAMKKRKFSAVRERKIANMIAPCQHRDPTLSGKEVLPGTSHKADLLINKTDLTKPLELTGRFRELLGLIEQLYSRQPSPQIGNSPLTTEPE